MVMYDVGKYDADDVERLVEDWIHMWKVGAG